MKDKAPDTRKGGSPHPPHWKQMEEINGSRRESEVEELPEEFGKLSEPLPADEWLEPTEQDDPTDEIDEIEEALIGRTSPSWQEFPADWEGLPP